MIVNDACGWEFAGREMSRKVFVDFKDSPSEDSYVAILDITFSAHDSAQVESVQAYLLQGGVERLDQDDLLASLQQNGVLNAPAEHGLCAVDVLPAWCMAQVIELAAYRS